MHCLGPGVRTGGAVGAQLVEPDLLLPESLLPVDPPLLIKEFLDDFDPRPLFDDLGGLLVDFHGLFFDGPFALVELAMEPEQEHLIRLDPVRRDRSQRQGGDLVRCVINRRAGVVPPLLCLPELRHERTELHFRQPGFLLPDAVETLVARVESFHRWRVASQPPHAPAIVVRLLTVSANEHEALTVCRSRALIAG